MNNLLEDSRQLLINKGKSGEPYKHDWSKGKNRYQRRTHSRIANSVRQYNDIDMNKLFKDDILTVGIKVLGETNTYLVRISFGGFLNILQRELKDEELTVKHVIRALIRGFNQDDVYIHCSCLHPDTKIKLLDSTSPTVAELKSRFDSGEKLYLFSVDEKGDFKPGEIEKVWITGETKSLIKITLDNDESITTTSDHLYMLRDGSYLPAEDLKIGQSLMSLCFNNWDELSSYFNLNHKVKNIEYILLDNSIPVYDIKVKDYANFLTAAGVILHNCPDWTYRMAYWATRGDINSGEPQYSNGKWIRNPDNKLGPGCKHVMLVLSNAAWLIKVASVIFNYINYMKDHMQKAYADVMYPAIYGKEYEEPVQLDIFDDTLDSTDTDIDISNAEARKRGQFKKGNEYRFTPSNSPIEDQETIEDEIIEEP